MSDIGTIAIVVPSCDNYSDLWTPFFQCLHRFWPDCPYPIYLITNHKQSPDTGATTISIGDDLSWSDNLITALRQIPEPYVFVHIEDLFLVQKVNTVKVKTLFDWAIANKINYLKTIRGHHNAGVSYNDWVCGIPRGSLYRASLMMTLYKKEVLLNLLKHGESAWDFEVHATERSDSYDNFYQVKENYFSIINTIIKRKWQRSATKLMRTLNISIDLSSRQVMTYAEQFRYTMRVFRAALFGLFPVSVKRKLKKLLGGGKYK